VAYDEQGGDKEPAAKRSGYLPEGCSGVLKMTPMEVPEVAYCQTHLDLAVIEVAGLTA
jgi:hypothetical protein